MRILRNRLLRRFSVIGRIADLALVGGLALRFARSQGWISGSQIDQFGIDPDVEGQPGLVEIVLLGAALGRLLRRKKR